MRTTLPLLGILVIEKLSNRTRVNTDGYLVPLIKEMGQHARWKAAKLNRDVYGEKVSQEITGKDGGPVENKNSVTFYMPEKAKDA